MLRNKFSLPQLRLTNWSFFVHSTTLYAPYVHPSLDLIVAEHVKDPFSEIKRQCYKVIERCFCQWVAWNTCKVIKILCHSKLMTPISNGRGCLNLKYLTAIVALNILRETIEEN